MVKRVASGLVLLLLIEVAPWIGRGIRVHAATPSKNAGLTPAFVTQSHGRDWKLGPHGRRRSMLGAALNVVPPENFASSMWTAVETFDGSTIVDPVVVSNVFWAGLKGKIISVIIGQLLAALAFAALASVVANQLPSFLTSLRNDTTTFLDTDDDDSQMRKTNTPQETLNYQQRRAISPDLGKLALSIAIDVIGSSSELVPVFGEVTDVIWAPIAGLALRSLYGGTNNILFALEFAEEILPFTDILPLATVCWVIETFYGNTSVAKALQIGDFDARRKTITIDVDASRDNSNPKLMTDGNEDEPTRRS
uniref:Uncharacterized protein n=1 Tax=Attheya septentrionalis TaxID=420275 RepID=A0A7S2XSI7_9STRA|mmetsp:Transcript_4840/g.8498  ORF Transcript_4840/g.8498 Transcript_4840/m.8498 type:complete len:308 (+) Transcript_4840:3-926(+)